MTPTFVIDCSITMAWCFSDESTAATVGIQDRLVREACVVPVHWPLEVANVLAMAEKRKRIAEPASTQFLSLLSVMEIHVDLESSSRAFGYALPLCRSHGLTSYDAAYLDLALCRQLPLASLDDALRRAAVSLGVEVLGK